MIGESVFQTIRQSEALAESVKVIVAVSGGCDSVALLHILRSLQTRLGMELHVASLDHGIRGEAGQFDLRFVRDLAERWQLPCTVERVDVPKLAQSWNMGLEAAARRARYDFLATVAQQESSRCVALGHHANDQAETILMHITRGSGTRGLGGMRILSPMPLHPTIMLLRPLLSLSRNQLEAYCAEHRLAFQHDESNSDTQFSRNFLRHEVVQKLIRLNPDALGAFIRLAESAAVDEDYFAEVIAAKAMIVVAKSERAWRIDKMMFFALHPALQRRLLREAIRQLGDAYSTLSHNLTLDLIAWSMDARTGALRDVGSSIQLRVDYEHLCIVRRGMQMMPEGYRLIPRNTDVRITSSAPYARHGLNISLVTDSANKETDSTLLLAAGCEVRLRTRRPGDRFKPKGMGGQTRKLKNWMIDRKIPRYIRDQIPLLCVDDVVSAICLGQTWHRAERGQSTASKKYSYFLTLE